MLLRLSSKSDKYFVRENGADLDFIWSTPIQLVNFSHLALISVNVWKHKILSNDELCDISCNLVESTVLNPNALIFSGVNFKRNPSHLGIYNLEYEQSSIIYFVFC